MIAVLLAGGKGTRLGKTGRFTPKPLIDIGGEPVINHLVDKLLSFPMVKSIYVLTKKKQTIEVRSSATKSEKLDLFTAFEKWKEVWYPDNNTVEVVYEDDLPAIPKSFPARLIHSGSQLLYG